MYNSYFKFKFMKLVFVQVKYFYLRELSVYFEVLPGGFLALETGQDGQKLPYKYRNNLINTEITL